VMYEIEGVDEPMARHALALAASKIPLATRFVSRERPL